VNKVRSLVFALRQPGRLVSLTVVTLSACYAVLLLTLTTAAANGVLASVFGDNPSVIVVLAILAFAFLVISVVVSTVVISNTYSIVTASRVRDIALRRLLGSEARTERRRIAADGLGTGLTGAVLGGLLGIAISVAAIRFAADNQELLLDADAAGNSLTPLIAVPLALIVLCTWWAAWRGSRGVIDVQPIQALGVAAIGGSDESEARSRTPLAGLITLAIGVVLLLGTAALGVITPLASLLGLVAGTVTVIGFIGSASWTIPFVLRLVDLLLPRTFGAKRAAESLQRHPLGTSRAALGVTISVAVVTMFVVASASFEATLTRAYAGSESEGDAYSIIGMVLVVVLALISFTVVIAAIGLANAVSLSTRLRSREIALMRVLGQTRAGVAGSIVSESARLSIAATVTGLVMGFAFGWIGTQSLLGSIRDIGLVIPVVPPLFLVGAVAAGLALTVVASVSPTRDVLKDAPIEAFSRA